MRKHLVSKHSNKKLSRILELGESVQCTAKSERKWIKQNGQLTFVRTMPEVLAKRVSSILKVSFIHFQGNLTGNVIFIDFKLPL